MCFFAISSLVFLNVSPTSCVLVKVLACACMYAGVCLCIFVICAWPTICPTRTRQTSPRAHLSFISQLAESRASLPHVRHLGLWLCSAPPAIFFFCRLLLSTSPPLFVLLLPLTLHQAHWPTKQVSSNKHFYTCPSGKISLLPCHTRITWRCNSLQTHCCVDEPRALFRNEQVFSCGAALEKFAFYWPN